MDTKQGPSPSESELRQLHQELAEARGRIAGLQQALEDERTKAQEHNRRLSTLLDNLPGMAYRCALSADWRMQFVSRACEALTGWEPEELVENRACSYATLIVEEDRARVEELIFGAVEQGHSFELEYRIRHRAGELKWVWEKGIAVRGEDGRVVALEGFILDITEQSRAIAALREREEQFALIAESITDVIWVYNVEQDRFVYISPAVQKLRGYTPDEAMQQNLLESLGPNSVGLVMQQVQEGEQATTDGDTVSFTGQVQQPCKDGSFVWVEVSTRARRTQEGQIEVFGVSRNIEERRRHERALRQSEEKFRRLVEGLGERHCIFSQTPEGVITFISAGIESIFGFRADDVVGRNWRELDLDNCSRLLLQAADESVLAEGSSQLVELSGVVHSGQRKTLELVQGPVYAGGEIIAIEGICTDVTERQRSEALLSIHLSLLAKAEQEPTESVLRVALEEIERLTDSKSSMLLFIEAESARLATWSRAALQTFPEHLQGEHHQHVMQVPIWRVCIAEKRALFHNQALGVGSMPSAYPGKQRTLLVPIVRGERVVAVCATFDKVVDYGDDDRRVVAYIADVVWEIAENKRLEAQQRALQASLAQADRLSSMGMLAASVAHEINNPLSFVLHNLESLGRELPRLFGRLQSCCENAQRHLDEEALVRVMGPEAERVQSSDFAEQQEMLQDALLGTRRIRELTHSLGSFSRVEHTELQALDVNHAVQHAISMAYNEIRYRARLVTQLNAVPLILASEGKIAQVILNLLINAAHAIVEGQIHQNQIRIRSWVERQLVHVEISDTGHGIKAEHQARIFDPFFTTKESGQGSGLGLAICKSIVDNFGGEISFESEWGRGTVFWLRFPIQGDRPASRPRIPILPDVVEEGRRGRLLVVEDEALLQKTLRRILGAEHEVVCASSGEEAQQLLEADTAFDMVLCDLMMPQMSGMELHAWLLQEAPELVNRMVFMTGGAFTSEASAFLDQVPNLRLEKPFEQDTVVKLVRKILAAG